MKKVLQNNKGAGLILFAGIYAIAYLIGSVIAAYTDSLIGRLFWFDLTATVVIWAISLILCNSSLYDAYWSLTPMVMVFYAATQYYDSLNIYHFVFIAVFLLWSTRLTVNWIVTFENLSWEDWRYRQYREQPKPLWHLANFFGIMLIPTIFVFIGMIPVFVLLTLHAGALSLVGSAIILLGTALEFFADRQMHRFLRETAEQRTCIVGLWKYSRHPNYLGEILIWFGAYIALICTDFTLWYLCGGVVLMLFLFNVISIPLAEKRHLSRRPDYAAYRESTSKLLLLPHFGQS